MNFGITTAEKAELFWRSDSGLLKAFHRKASIESICCPRISTIKSYVIEIWGQQRSEK